MSAPPVLTHPEAIRFPENRPYAESWATSGGRMLEQPTGHRVVYGSHGKRILLADPDGHPLHECVWKQEASGEYRLLAARLWLDWGQWVGIKPQGLVNSLSLDLTRQPGWERVTREDLRHMAARSMHSEVETIRFFYRDEDLILHGDGNATIRQVKDAFYVLPNGAFEGARFMSCMSRMEWGRIDYLPVVELFLSLLPGTGSATFELIRGLYDDQNPTGARPLYYRGIPVYPSNAAFRLFSLFFTPFLSTGETPLQVFLDPGRSQEVCWLPAHEFPVRYVDESQRLCLTVNNHKIQKATRWDDPAGLSYVRVTDAGRSVADNRGVTVEGEHLVLHDGKMKQAYTIRPTWNVAETPSTPSFFPETSSWRNCFPEGPPSLTPHQAFSSVLLYPDHQECIGEQESQPFVFDFFDDFLEEHPELSRQRSAATRVLIAHCDAALGACLPVEASQEVTVWYVWPEFAQKQAQALWNKLARKSRLSWLSHFQLLPLKTSEVPCLTNSYHWMYLWVPYSGYTNAEIIGQWAGMLAAHLAPGGVGCVAGPPHFGEVVQRRELRILHAEPGEDLPTFRIHQTILPYGRLHQDLHAWIIQKP